MSLFSTSFEAEKTDMLQQFRNPQSAITMLPSQYCPLAPAEFLGDGAEGARTVARHIQRAAALARANDRAPLKLFFAGEPGVGKSALVRFLGHTLGCGKFDTHKYNGASVKMELVEQLAQQMVYRPMTGDYRLIWIDEADEIPRVAQVRTLTLLDDLPAGNAIVCTSNCSVANFEKRFQSRFQFFTIAGPPNYEIEMLLRRWIDPENARAITITAAGNVRQALLDADGVVQAAALAA
jgi:DNA polymerase III delta prime subunit